MILGLICVIFYLAAAGVIASRLFHHQGPNPKLSAIPALIAILVHAYLLNTGILQDPGQNMSMVNVASLIAWVIALTMTIASFSLANAILLPVVYGFSALIVLIGVFVPSSHIMQIDVRPALIIHIVLALFAYGCLIIAFLYALQLSYINTKLKEKKASLLHSSLPPLMTVESIFFKLLFAGTVLLTLSLASGFAFLDDMLAKEQAHKTVLSVIAWVIYCITLVGHNRWGWRGKSVITATVVGACLLTLAYFGSRFVREVLINA